MAHPTASTKRQQKPAQARIGRPPRDLAAEVDDRILEAARRVFLENGYGGASVGEIARLARAGKTSVYARFPTKEALFAAVGARNAAHAAGRFETYTPEGGTTEERLVDLGVNILERLLVADTIDFMRMSAAEARRFPELAKVGSRAREGGAKAVASVLRNEAQSKEAASFSAFAPERLAETTNFFIDLVVARLLMRALFGEDLILLRAQIREHVIRGVGFFLEACRPGSAKQ